MKTAWIVLIFLSLLIFPCFARYSGGAGTKTEPYLIATPNNLMDIRNHIEDYNKYFLMTNDINLAGFIFDEALIAPDINDSQDTFQGTAFTGTLNGNGHSIISLTINKNEGCFLGLFGKIGSFGTTSSVYNLKIENVNIMGKSYLGGLCGLCENAEIKNCSSKGLLITGNNSRFIGGLCGENLVGEISNCQANIIINTGNITLAAGGLCGNNNGVIENSKSSGSITCRNDASGIGGLCGSNETPASIVNNCISRSCIHVGNYSNFTGGLVGFSFGQISNSLAAGFVKGGNNSSFLGGLCGGNDNQTVQCAAHGNVNAGRDSNTLGGLNGSNSGPIANCYATGSVKGGDFSSNIGGLCGYNQHNGSIDHCYATGKVIGGLNSTSIGGLCGFSMNSLIHDAYWDTETSNILISSGGGTGLITAQMYDANTYTSAGWDFVNETDNGTSDIWIINDDVDYPSLTRERINLNDSERVDFIDYSILTNQFTNECPREFAKGDIDDDSKINFIDYALLLNYFKKNNCGTCGGADLDGDREVDYNDLLEFTLHWLAPYDCYGADIDLSGDVAFDDLKILMDYWLE